MAIAPFSISPDPASLFLTPSLKAAIHKIRYVIDKRQGLTCLLGDAGMGKSSVLRLLFASYESEPQVTTAFLPDPEFTSPYAFVRSICEEFEVAPKRSLHDQKNALKAFIVGQAEVGKNVVLLLDEAQGLDAPMLEIVRSFLNYESNRAKLLQIVLAGQLELRARLKAPANKALKSRIIMYSLLDPLSLSETRSMLAHRCELAEIALPFSDDVLARIYDAGGGVPREVLRICADAYELSELKGEKRVTVETVEEVLAIEARILETEEVA